MNLCLSRLVLISFLLSCTAVLAQTEPFALPVHKGAMLLDLKGFHVTQSSAKPNGNELGIRAHDDGHTGMLAFLFLTPDKHLETAASCRQAESRPNRERFGR